MNMGLYQHNLGYNVEVDNFEVCFVTQVQAQTWIYDFGFVSIKVIMKLDIIIPLLL